jgi:hypothetical protein
MRSPLAAWTLFSFLFLGAFRPLSAQDSPFAAPAPVAGGPAMERLYVGAGGGYSGVSLAEAERNLELLIRAERQNFEDNLLFWGSGVVGTPVARMEEVTGGSFLMTEAGYRFTPRISAGLRFFRYFLPDLTGLYEENGSGGESIRAEHTFTADLTKWLLGVAVERGFSGGDLVLRVDGAAGAVFLSSDATVQVQQSVIGEEPVAYTQTIPYSGTGLGMDFGLRVEYAFRSGFGAFAEAGYSIANVPRMKVREETSITGTGETLPKGTVLMNEVDGEPIECDMGGIRLGAGLRARF